MFKKFGKQRGFTLIELLVVIAIIAILAAILFPVFSRAKQNANNTGCMTNLNQMGKATLTYLDDFEGYYWGRNEPFTMALNRYLKNVEVYKCKGDGRRQQATDAVAGRDGARCSYLCNGQLWEWTDSFGSHDRLRMPEIAVSTKFVLFVDDGFEDAANANPTRATEKMTYAYTNSARAFYHINQKGRHQGIDNYVMADTHVRYVKGGLAEAPDYDKAYVYANLTWDPAVRPNNNEIRKLP